MRLRAARLHAYRLPLRSPWVSAAERFDLRRGWLVRLETDEDRVGFGDCAPLPSVGTETGGQAQSALVAWCAAAPGRQVDEALARLDLAAAPAARGAIECALLDLQAQAASLPLVEWLAGGVGARGIDVNAAIGTLDPAVRDRAETAAEAGIAVLKIKVGVAPVEAELPGLRELAAALTHHARLRLDANQAWDEATAARFLDACADLPVESVEEPLAGGDWAALRRLQARCPFPLAVDESWSAAAAERFFADSPVRRLVLKLPRLGGPLPAWSLSRRAAAAGVACVVTSCVDSACGIAAAAHVAAALGNGLAHGLATSSWLAADVGVAPEITGGKLMLAAGAGLGFVPGAGIVFSEPRAVPAMPALVP